MNRLAIFVSGHGTNAREIIKHFNGHKNISIALVVATKDGIGAIDIAKEANVPCVVCRPGKDFEENGVLDKTLSDFSISHIVLAGCLAFIPDHLTARYHDRIINIHPSLLPKFGGKGMYGDRVHKAVIESGEKESGITIHLVNDEYDSGHILFQARCEVKKDDTIDSLASRIHSLEHIHYPQVIEEWCEG